MLFFVKQNNVRGLKIVKKGWKKEACSAAVPLTGSIIGAAAKRARVSNCCGLILSSELSLQPVDCSSDLIFCQIRITDNIGLEILCSAVIVFKIGFTSDGYLIRFSMPFLGNGLISVLIMVNSRSSRYACDEIIMRFVCFEIWKREAVLLLCIRDLCNPLLQSAVRSGSFRNSPMCFCFLANDLL